MSNFIGGVFTLIVNGLQLQTEGEWTLEESIVMTEEDGYTHTGRQILKQMPKPAKLSGGNIIVDNNSEVLFQQLRSGVICDFEVRGIIGRACSNNTIETKRFTMSKASILGSPATSAVSQRIANLEFTCDFENFTIRVS